MNYNKCLSYFHVKWLKHLLSKLAQIYADMQMTGPAQVSAINGQRVLCNFVFQSSFHQKDLIVTCKGFPAHRMHSALV